MNHLHLTTRIFRQARQAGWLIQFENSLSNYYSMVATHRSGFRLLFERAKNLAASDLAYLCWLLECARVLETCAVPRAGQDLRPKPFFTALHYQR